jgi:hypothetical protein
MYINNFIMNPRSFVKASFTLVSLLLLSGCSGMDVLDRDFGKSVRMMEQAQIYDMNAAMNPSPEGPEGISGNKSLADLYDLERPVRAEGQMLNLIKAKRYDVGDKK